MARAQSLKIAALIAALVATLVSAAAAVAYNNFDHECWWSNPSGANLYVNWHWGPNINVSGGWANDFRNASYAWSNAGTKVRRSGQQRLT